ncbi:MAG TPA: hypothetical protein DCS91_02700 [Microcoleaceae bacterium UBA11344]|nr:hypothetical protein [Microcoleaceae cyanobacterium UBA11344]
MPIKPSASQSLPPLSVGNVVSTGLVLYRSHLKSYLSISLRATLWVILPTLVAIPLTALIPSFIVGSRLNFTWWLILLWILLLSFGWAKYLANSALISRLAFSELIDRPETVSNARNYIQPRMWSFLSVALNVGFLLFLVFVLLYFLMGVGAIIIVSVISGVVLPSLTNNPIGSVIASILIVIMVLAGLFGFFFGFIWFFSRWIIAEVPLAVEEDINVAVKEKISVKQSIDRSWELTKNSVFRIQLVVLVAFLVTLPLIAVTSYIPQIFLLGAQPGSTLYWTIYGISILTSSGSQIFVLPFWQVIKAVIYYDLRSRKEGLGLQLRDSI